MLFLIFIYYLVQGASESVDASPIPSLDKLSLEANRCTDLTHCRTVWNIIWSCLITIFSCTWVAVHPNIPCPRKQNPVISFAEHRLPLFICALLVPEYVLAWAIRQYLRARVIAKENRREYDTFCFCFGYSHSLPDLQWSKTHGFFIIMGGFHLFERGSEETINYDIMSHEEDTPLHPLAVGNINKEDKTIDIDYSSFTVPTEAEIKDKGKSDWLAKSLVLIQTSWFVMQCIARGIEHLPVTHLEIVTLAYAAMNFVIYIFWWNKPLNVNRPVRVFRKLDSQPQVREPISEAQEANSEVLGEMFSFILGFQDENVNLSRKDRVPRFWANSSIGGEQSIIADLIMLGVGICFGAIHCIAWHFSFSTHTELLMWQISSVAITAVPVYIYLVLGLGAWLGGMDPDIFGVIFMHFGPLSGGILYVLARAVTLVLALTSLRDLPPGAYEAVHWTTFIPHV